MAYQIIPFFRHLQIRHDLHVQFKTQAVEWSKISLLQRIIKPDISKGLISELYAQLCSKTIAWAMSFKNKERWEEDMGEITP